MELCPIIESAMSSLTVNTVDYPPPDITSRPDDLLATHHQGFVVPATSPYKVMISQKEKKTAASVPPW